MTYLYTETFRMSSNLGSFHEWRRRAAPNLKGYRTLPFFDALRSGGPFQDWGGHVGAVRLFPTRIRYNRCHRRGDHL
jgi:hypothetical protein